MISLGDEHNQILIIFFSSFHPVKLLLRAFLYKFKFFTKVNWKSLESSQVQFFFFFSPVPLWKQLSYIIWHGLNNSANIPQTEWLWNLKKYNALWKFYYQSFTLKYFYKQFPSENETVP